MNQQINGIKIALYCLMLFMLLSRLVWIQIRQYDQPVSQKSNSVIVDSQSNMHQEIKTFFSVHHISINQAALLTTVFSSAFMIRFISGSWLFALFSSNILLSRGSLITAVGFSQTDLLLQLVLMLWLTGIAHFLRSGSPLAFLFSLISLVGGFFIDQLVIFMMLPMMFLLFMVKGHFFTSAHPLISSYRYKAIHKIDQILPSPHFVLNAAIRKFSLVLETSSSFQKLTQYFSSGSVSEKNSLFSTLKEPFLIWIKTSPRSAKLLSITGMLFVLCFSLIFLNEAFCLQEILNPQAEKWFDLFFKPIDLHYAACLLIICLNLIHASSKGLTGVFELTWVITITFIIMACIAFLLHLLFQKNDFTLVSSSYKVILWFEPIALSFGFASFYHLTKIISSRHL